jgi:hypothetical protein
VREVILIHPEAPAKPPLGAPCNGCGVCCLAEPCPVGVLVSRRRTGACTALRWSNSEGRYHCGLMIWGNPASVSAANDWPDGKKVGFAPHRAAHALFASLWHRWVRRIISAGSGCDASLEVIRGDPESPQDEGGSPL